MKEERIFEIGKRKKKEFVIYGKERKILDIKKIKEEMIWDIAKRKKNLGNEKMKEIIWDTGKKESWI